MSLLKDTINVLILLVVSSSQGTGTVIDNFPSYSSLFGDWTSCT
jgi:hypothetical protein